MISAGTLASCSWYHWFFQKIHHGFRNFGTFSVEMRLAATCLKICAGGLASRHWSNLWLGRSWQILDVPREIALMHWAMGLRNTPNICEFLWHLRYLWHLFKFICHSFCIRVDGTICVRFALASQPFFRFLMTANVACFWHWGYFNDCTAKFTVCSDSKLEASASLAFFSHV